MEKRILAFEELSQKQQTNVREVYVTPNLGEIILVIDDTAFRGCKDGLILTEHFIATKEMFQKPVYYPLEYLKSIECINKKLLINGNIAYKFTLVEQDELDEFCAFMNEEPQEEDVDDSDNDSPENTNEGIENENVAVADSGIKRDRQAGLEEFVAVEAMVHETWTELLSRASGRRAQAQITAQRKFILEVMQLCREWNDTLSCEAQKRLEEENLFRYDLCCYLPALTYIASHIAHLLEKEAEYNHEQTVRYVQFPLLIMKCIFDINMGKSGGRNSVAAASRKNSALNESAVFRECMEQYDLFLSYLNEDFLFGEQYVFFAATAPWLAHENEEDEKIFHYRKKTKVVELMRSKEFVDFVENEFQILEDKTKTALLAILKEYGPYDQIPNDLNSIKPYSIRMVASTEGMRKRVRSP